MGECSFEAGALPGRSSEKTSESLPPLRDFGSAPASLAGFSVSGPWYPVLLV